MESSSPPNTVTDAPPYRLRELRGRDRLLALGLLVLVLVPFVVALIRAYQHSWLPNGDEANIATRALDVFSRHPPLTGLPSTSGFYGKGIVTQHPGPFEFYLLAVPIRVLGATTGSLLTAETINATFVVIALWTIYRRAGLWAMLGAGVVMQAVLWSVGTAVLSETLSSEMTMYSMLCTAVLAWAVADGDYRLLPLTVIVATYAAQQHLAAVLIVLPLVVAGCILLVIGLVTDARSDAVDRLSAAKPFAVGAVIAGVVCWIPVIVDQITGHPGNLTAIVRFARDNSRQTLGIHAGLRELARAIAPPTLLTMSNVNGITLNRRLGTTHAVAGALTVALLVFVVVLAFRHHRSLARFAGITLVLVGAGVVNGSNVPAGIEVFRAAEFRWTWTAAFMTWTTFGWAFAVLLRPRDRLHGLVPVIPIALLLVAAIIGVTTITTSGADDVPPEAEAYALDRRVDAAVFAHIDHHQPIAVLYRGTAAIVVGYQLVFRLVQAGYRVELSPASAHALGTWRRFRPKSNPMAVMISSGNDSLPRAPGKRISEQIFDRRYVELLDELSADAAAAPITLAPDAEARANRLLPGSFPIVRDALTRVRDDPRGLLSQPALVSLILKGVYRAPGLDRTKLERLVELASRRKLILGDERLSVSVLTPAQVRTYPPRELISFAAA